MKIERLPSGSYRVRKTIQGKAVAVTLPYKPTQKEAVRLLEDKWSGRDKLRMTFNEAAGEYIKGKRNTLSPSTLRAYETMRRNIPDLIRDKSIGDLTAWDVQKFVNDLSLERTPKTVRNYSGFVSAVLGTFRHDLTLNTTLPQKRPHAPHVPSDEDVRRILEAVSGTKYEIPFRLACYGLRRSEICALTPDDLDGDVLTINKALVQGDDREWHVKTTKTTHSTRKVILDDALCALIRSQDVIYDGSPHVLYDHLHIILRDLQIAPFPFHAFRHYYATTMHAQGVPDAVVMASGGWKTDHVMKSIYRHEKAEQVTEMQRRYAMTFRDNI